MFQDLRGYIEAAREFGELKVIEGADRDLEIGAITEWQASVSNGSALLFDKINGFPAGYRVVTNLYGTDRRVTLCLGLPLEAKGVEIVKALRHKLNKLVPVPPVEVNTGPVKENVHVGEDVDLFEFPAPQWHRLDGGRYIGTGDMVIVRDPDEGWVNLGTHRTQVHDKSTATIYASPGKHLDIIRRKYWAKGLSCPAAVSCGQEMTLYAIGGFPIPWGMSEYDYAGGMRNSPVEVTRGVYTGLPIPATSEIVLEGEIVPPEVETREEGPFGEGLGYYASGSRAEAAFQVKAILHRHKPIIHGDPPVLGSRAVFSSYRRSALVWNDLERNVPAIRGVWLEPRATSTTLVVISIEQQYGGHAKQAAMAALGCRTIAYLGRYIIVVDEDIDPSNMGEVIWAMSTRSEPDKIDIIEGCWDSLLDPTVSPEKKERGDITNSRAIIYACRPYYRLKEFPPTIKRTPAELQEVKAKWSKLL